MVRILKLQCLSNFRVYNMVLLAVVTMLYLRSLEHTPEYLTAESLYTLFNISPFLPPLVLGNHHSTLCFYEFVVFKFHVEVRSYAIYFYLSDLLHFTLYPQGIIHVVTNVRIFLFLIAEYYYTCNICHIYYICHVFLFFYSSLDGYFG